MTNRLTSITLADRTIAYLALVSGLSISAVAVYYSVAGLVSIFAAAAIPIMVMGVVLELSKLVATVWLKQYWDIAPRPIKVYLTTAVVILMLITSMGIFGYLSKAHLDQNMVSGDVVNKVSILDEKIKTQRDNIEVARTALKQLDAAVDQTMSRSSDEKGAERAVQIRRQQAAERGRLQNDISKAQTEISRLQAERAPIASELRKVEAEVGPIKYIAALIYGDNPDQNTLERAVRWVIIMIVVIFDPLAVCLLLASQYSFMWFRNRREDEAAMGIAPPDNIELRPFTQEEIAALDGATPEERYGPAPEGHEYRGTWPFPLPKDMPKDDEIDTAETRVNYQVLDDADDETPAPDTTRPTPQEEFEQAAEQRREAIKNIAEQEPRPAVIAKGLARRRKVEKKEQEQQAASVAAAPPGTPGETWTTAPVGKVEQTMDELDKVYREASAAEARKKRSRGWLQSNFPTQDE